MTIFSQTVGISTHYSLDFRRWATIFARGYCANDIDTRTLNGLFRTMEWVRVGSAPMGQWAPPLREWTPEEHQIADEVNRQYKEVFAKIDESLAIIFPGETRENVSTLVQRICKKLHDGERVDFTKDEEAKKALVFIRDITARLADAMPVPI